MRVIGLQGVRKVPTDGTNVNARLGWVVEHLPDLYLVLVFCLLRELLPRVLSLRLGPSKGGFKGL